MKVSRFGFVLMVVMVGFFTLFSFGREAFAVTLPGNYQQLENIPGFENQTNSFPEYVSAIYKLGLWIIGISAMFMLTVGGFMYVTSAGNTASASTAKGVIKDALIGLALGLSAWLIVNTINPDLTTLNISGLQNGTSVTPPPGGQTPPASATGQYTNAEAVTALNNAGISIKSTGNCSDQNNKDCTSLEGIPKDAIDKLITLKQKCNCSFNVTGGTEIGHASHGAGLPVMDVTQDQILGDYLSSNKSNLSTLGINKICATSAWQRISYNCSGYVEQQQHFHLAF